MSEHTIEGLQDKLERLIAERRAWYRRGVDKKTLASDVAVEKDKELSAIQRIWSTWADHAPELREMGPEIKRRRLERKMREQNAPPHRRQQQAKTGSKARPRPREASSGRGRS